MIESIAISARPRLEEVSRLLHDAGLPTADLTERHCEHFFYVGSATGPTGLIGLEPYDEVALLRSLVVTPAARAAGVGSALLRHAEEHARAIGVRRLYLLTTTADEFFARRGYQLAPRDSAPASIRTTREFAGICPASSAFMSKPL
jgi:amino-acid N-acetyltransferase